MKIVINTTYGGFNLSAKAVKWLADKRGKTCHFFKSSYDTVTLKYNYAPITEVFPQGLFWSAFSTDKPTVENYDEYSLHSRKENRADPLLIQLVEELGQEANGTYCKLKVVEIPDGVNYQISEFDGQEWIAEAHRTWE